MEASRRMSLWTPIVIADKNLGGLNSVFRDFSDKVIYRVGCADGLSRSFGDIRKFREFSNATEQAISWMKVVLVPSNRFDRHAEISFSPDRDAPPVRVDVTGPE